MGKFQDRFVNLAMGSAMLLVTFMVLLFIVQLIGSLFFVGNVVNWNEEAGPATTARLYESTYDNSSKSWTIKLDTDGQPVYSEDFKKWKADEVSNDEIIDSIKAFITYMFGSLYLIFALLTVLGIDLDDFLGNLKARGKKGSGSSGGF